MHKKLDTLIFITCARPYANANRLRLSVPTPLIHLRMQIIFERKSFEYKYLWTIITISLPKNFELYKNNITVFIAKNLNIKKSHERCCEIGYWKGSKPCYMKLHWDIKTIFMRTKTYEEKSMGNVLLLSQIQLL